MKNFLDLVKSRNSIRAYDPQRKPQQKKLLEIIEAARLAPSACNKQPWNIYLVESPAVLEKVKQAYSRDWIKNAPYILVISGIKEIAWTRSDGFNSLDIDLSIAMDHLILAATDKGLASCWIAAFDPIKLASALSLEKDEIPLLMTPLGFSLENDSKKERPRKSMEEILTIL